MFRSCSKLRSCIVTCLLCQITLSLSTSQISFLAGLQVIGEIRTLFSAEVSNKLLSNLRPPQRPVITVHADNNMAIRGMIALTAVSCALLQLMLRSKTLCFSKGSIIADSQEDAKGLMVITSGQVCSKSKLYHFIICRKSGHTP